MQMEEQTPNHDNTLELAPLPPEIWTMVFRHLGPFCLSRVRLACRTWNQIVCNSRALMDNFCIQLNNDSFVESAENVRALVTGSSDGGGRFTRARFREVTLIIPELVGAFWAPMAENLHTLSIVKCKFRFGFVVQLLEQTRNLRFLFYCDLEPRKDLEDVRCTFQLAGLRHLRLMLHGNRLDAKILRIFREMCPRLEGLDIKPKPRTQKFCHEVVSFVMATRDTLRELAINPTEDLIEELAYVDGLNLTRLKVDSDVCSVHDFFLFIKAQEHNLQSLKIFCENGFFPDLFQDLHEAGCTFPKLTNLQVCIYQASEYPDANFLHFLPKLENLQIEEVDFYYMNEKLPNINELTFTTFETFEDILKWMPNIRKIHIKDLSLSQDILELVRKSGNIEELTLNHETGDISLTSDYLNLDMVSFETHGSTKLRILNLQVKIPKKLLRTMLMVYPNLTELYFSYVPGCKDVFMICCELPMLKTLGLCSCGKCAKGRVTESPRPSELLVISCVHDKWRKVDRWLKMYAVKELRFVPCNFLKQDDYLTIH